MFSQELLVSGQMIFNTSSDPLAIDILHKPEFSDVVWLDPMTLYESNDLRKIDMQNMPTSVSLAYPDENTCKSLNANTISTAQTTNLPSDVSGYILDGRDPYMDAYSHAFDPQFHSLGAMYGCNDPYVMYETNHPDDWYVYNLHKVPLSITMGLDLPLQIIKMPIPYLWISLLLTDPTTSPIISATRGMTLL